MHIYAISPEAHFSAEASVIEALLGSGLDGYHLRKPAASEDEITDVLDGLPASCRSGVVLHQHHALVDAYDLAGYHLKDTGRLDLERGRIERGGCAGKTLSRSVHCLDHLLSGSGGWDYVFLSPVFNSISKAGYRAAWAEPELTAALEAVRSTSMARVCALGGINAERAAHAKAMDFDAVVLHGWLWEAANPLERFQQVRKAVA